MDDLLSGIDALLFDKDGTLVDYDRSWEPVNRKAAMLAARGDAALARRILAECGTDPDTGITRAGSLFAAGNAAEIAARMVRCGAPFTEVALMNGIDALFEESAAHAVPICDLAPVLDALAPRALGIATSDGEASARTTLAAFGLADRFGFVAGYDSGHGAKPGPGMVLAFAAALGLPPERVAVVGDNTHDMAMARAAGARAIAVLSGTGNREDLAPLADAVIGSVSDLRDACARR